MQVLDQEVSGKGSNGHGKTLPGTGNETLGSGSQTLRSHIGSDTGSRGNDQGRIDTLQAFQSQDEEVGEFGGNGVRGRSRGDQGVTEHANNTGSVSNDEDPVDTEPLGDFLGEEVEGSFGEDTDEDGIGDDVLLEVKFGSDIRRLVGGDDGTDETGNEDSSQEEGEARAGHQAEGSGTGSGNRGSRRSLLVVAGTMAMMTVAVGFNLQVSGDSEEDGGNETNGSDDQSVEHDLVILTGPVIDGMDNDTNDAVTNGTPQTLTTEHFLAKLRVGRKLAHDHGIQEREGTGSEEEAGSIDAQIVGKLESVLAFTVEDGEEQQAHAETVSGNTPGNNGTILTSTIGKTGEDKGTGNVGELDKVGQGVFVLLDTPGLVDVLEEEGVGGVDDYVQTEVEHLGNNQPIFNEIGESTSGTASFGVGDDGRIRGTGVRRLFSGTGHVDVL